MKTRLLWIFLTAVLAAALIGCAAEPNDFPPRPTESPTPIEILPGPTFAPTATAQPGQTSGGVTVSTSPGGEGTAVAPPAPPTQMVGGPTSPAEPPSDGGQIDVTMDDNNKTLTLTLGQSFLLKLDTDLAWDIQIEDPSVIVQAQTFAAIPGAQGLFVTAKRGQTGFSATGTAICPAGQACPMFAILFKVTIVVK